MRHLVVIVLLARHPDFRFHLWLFAAWRAALLLLGRRVAALVAPADLALRAEALEHEIDRRRDDRRRRARREPRLLGQFAQALDAARLRDDFVGRRRVG